LPGVTVEAASPVLIEKVRSAVTDGASYARAAVGCTAMLGSMRHERPPTLRDFDFIQS